MVYVIKPNPEILACRPHSDTYRLSALAKKSIRQYFDIVTTQALQTGILVRGGSLRPTPFLEWPVMQCI